MRYPSYRNLLLTVLLFWSTCWCKGQGEQNQFVKSLVFTPNGVLVAVTCGRGCSVVSYKVEQGSVRKLSERATGWPNRRISALPDGTVEVNDELLSVPNLVPQRQPSQTAQSDNQVGRLTTAGGVSVRKVGSSLELDSGSGQVLRTFSTKNCVGQSAVLHDGSFILQGCGDDQVVSQLGEPLYHLSHFTLGYDLIDSSADGKRVLLLKHRSTRSWIKRTGDVALALATMGVGVTEDPDIVTFVSVLDRASGKECPLKSYPTEFPDYEHAMALTWDGATAAISTKSGFDIIAVPSTCP